MSENSSKTWLIITIIIALITSILVFSYLRGQHKADGTEIDTVVATMKISEGSRITPEMVKTVKIPAAYRHTHAIDNREKVINRLATVDIWPEQAILGGQLTTREGSDELPYRIPEGHRAITIAVDEVSGIAGHIQPGYRVDVLMWCQDPRQDNLSHSLTLLQNVLVLAVGSQVKEARDGQTATNITLAVNPDQAEYVMMAENTARIKLTLRPLTENEIVPLNKITLDWLLSQY